MAVSELKYHEITEKIIGCAMKAHRYFGPGFPEVIYKRALLIELRKISLTCRSEVETEIVYEGEVIGKRRLDVLVENNILLELKAVVELDNGCFAKIIKHLRVFNIEVGLLLNFGSSSLQFKRFISSSVKS